MATRAKRDLERLPVILTELVDLFATTQQLIGLKLEAQKTAVDVLAIDQGQRPSGN